MTITFDEKINPGDIIALGDIHATWELYEKFLKWVDNSGATVILLGDMIDRGGQDLKVLDSVLSRLTDPESFGLQSFHALMGNHERMFLDYAEFQDWSSLGVWLDNGGNLKQSKEMIQSHAAWLRELPIYMIVGENLFIHAGIFPGHDPQKKIREGNSYSLLWIREPFLKFGPVFDEWNPNLKRVIHGHTPTVFETGVKDGLPVVKEDRINIDTGAYINNEKHTGKLTAYNVTQNTFYHFSR